MVTSDTTTTTNAPGVNGTTTRVGPRLTPKLLQQCNTAAPGDAALAYAKAGLRVFPVWWVEDDGRCACGKLDCKDPGKHPLIPNNLEEATTNRKQIDLWWDKWPRANVGVVMGRGSNAWLLDVDPRHDGNASLDALCQEHGTTAEALRQSTLRQRTPRGGDHLVFLYPPLPPSQQVHTNVGELLAGLDLRGDNGYGLAPPSRTNNGRYAWLGGTLAPAPDWLVALVTTAAVPGGTRPSGTPRHQRSERVWHGEVIRDGRRNRTLHHTALSMLAKGYNDDAIRENVHRLNHTHCQPQLTEGEVDEALDSALKRDPGFVRSELGFSQWLTAQYAETLVFASGDEQSGGHGGEWLRYDDVAWRLTDPYVVQGLVDTALLALYRQALNRLDADLRDWSLKRQRQSVVEAVERALRHHCHELASQFARSRDLLALQGGTTLDLSDGEARVRPSRSTDRLRYALPITFDPAATCPTWHTTLTRWLDDDQERIDLLWDWMGSLLSGRRFFDKFPMLVGETRSGKTTFANALQRLLGGFATALPIGLLLKKRWGSGLDALEKERLKYGLLGKRLGVFSESAVAATLDGELLKELVGGDVVTARPMRQETLRFTAQHKLLLHSNHWLSDRGVDDAVIERLLLIRWTGTIPKDERDVTLEDKLVAEASGWLNTAVQGYRRVAARGLVIPASVEALTEPYHAQANTVGGWLKAERVPVSPAAVRWATCVKRFEALKRYREWCAREHLEALDKTNFYMEILRDGITAGVFDGNDVFKNLRLRQPGKENDDGPTINLHR